VRGRTGQWTDAMGVGVGVGGDRSGWG
jgi:hypothetical protein